ncbi:MAG: glycine cleavage system protein [Thermodesulfobacteriota bacterium]|nr:glycine cleavage system protein [Thermodesulfobacteriota bacterium]
MSKVNPTDRRYSREHEWAIDNGDGTVTLGITDHAQELLTDIVFVELPEIGKQVKQLETVAVVESVKSVSDVYSPVTGEVIDANQQLEQNPELINQDPYGQGWIAKLRMEQPAELQALLDAAGYEAFIAAEEHH